MGLYDAAAVAFEEAAYDAEGRGSMSLQVAIKKDWLQAANAEWHCGRVRTAADFLAKALAFGEPEQREEAKTLLEQVRKTERPPRDEPRPDSAKLLEVARLYASLGVQPRAVELLRRFEGLLEGSQLEALYLDQWVRRRSILGFQDRSELFGQDVRTDVDYQCLTIPPPASPGARQEAEADCRWFFADIILPLGPVSDEDEFAAFHKRCMLVRRIENALATAQRSNETVTGEDAKGVAETALKMPF